MSKLKQKLISIVAGLSLLLNSFAPLVVSPVYAQEATSSAQISLESTSLPVENPPATPSAQVEASPVPSPQPTPSPTPQPLWTENAGSYTTETLKLNTTYKFPPNEKVSLTFSKLPDSSGTVTVKETNALGTTAYDITSTMTDGTFEYILTLPTATTENVEVKASEDGQTFVTLGGVNPGDGILTITGLNHFTIFVIAGTIDETQNPDQGVPFDESGANILINEFVYDTSATGDIGEWVELYNRGATNVTLVGWTLVDAANNAVNLSGTISAGGFAVFENNSWLNNTGDTIFLKNGSTVVDKVTYTSAASGSVVDAQDIGSVAADQSVARTIDGGTSWAVDTTPTKGGSNPDSTAPTITIFTPLANTPTPSSATVFAATNEAATCTYSLDGGSNTAMDVTGSTSHTKALSGLATGSHNIRLTCTDASGNSSQSSLITWIVLQSSGNSLEISGSSVIFDSATLGQADLPSGITTLNLSNTTNFDVSAGLYTASGNNITIGGVVKNLATFTSGDLIGQDLSGIQSIGGISFEIEKAVALQSGTNGEPIFLTNSDLPSINVFLPDGVSVLAPNGWGGTIQPPKTGSSSGTAPSGFSLGNTIIEVGSADLVLLFDSPVTVILTGVTGPVGYKSAGSSSWIQITNTCGGTYASPTSPAFPGECAISDGTNTKVVTYHFTSFAALNTVSSSTSGGGQALSAAGAPSCNDTKPGSAPQLQNVVAGLNSVTLNWQKAANPVSYYLVNYSLTPAKFQFGNPNVGGADTTSYQVQGLSGGTTYYFKVRAGNGCAPGDYSNEVSATPTGGIVNEPAAGFAPGVLGAATKQDVGLSEVKGEEMTPTAEPTVQPSVSTPQPSLGQLIGGVFSVIFGFLARLFGR